MQLPPFFASIGSKLNKENDSLKFQSIRNIRDFRGMQNADGKQIKEGLFFRSAVLSDITREDLQKLEEEYHLCSIIDLRMAHELEELPDVCVMGAEYHHIPLLKERTVGITHEEESDRELAESVMAAGTVGKTLPEEGMTADNEEKTAPGEPMEPEEKQEAGGENPETVDSETVDPAKEALDFEAIIQKEITEKEIAYAREEFGKESDRKIAQKILPIIDLAAETEDLPVSEYTGDISAEGMKEYTIGVSTEGAEEYNAETHAEDVKEYDVEITAKEVEELIGEITGELQGEYVGEPSAETVEACIEEQNGEASVEYSDEIITEEAGTEEEADTLEEAGTAEETDTEEADALEETDASEEAGTAGKEESTYEDGEDENPPLPDFRMPRMRMLYRNMAESEYTSEQLRQVFAEICSFPKTGAVLWHCTEGKDRCGIVSALFLYLLDYDWDRILEDYLLTNKAARLRAMKYFGLTWLSTGSRAQAQAIRAAYLADESYLREYWEAITEKYGSMDIFLKDKLEITDEMRQNLKDYCLK